MTTQDMHRVMDDHVYTNFHRQKPMPFSSNLPTGTPQQFRSMTASELINMIPNPSGAQQQQQPSLHKTHSRPASDMLQGSISGSVAEEAIDRWYKNIQRYEQMLEEVAAASADQSFKDELHHVNQWFRGRSDAERTAALYTVIQNASPVQIRFLITVLQQLANQDPFGDMLSLAGQEKVPVVAGSVVSTETAYEMRKQQHMYPPSRRTTRPNMYNRLTSALSEPDDLRRRHRDLLIPQTLGLSHSQNLLLEKALEAQAQIQAAGTPRNTNASPLSNSFVPRMKSSSSTTDTSSATGSRSSLFGNDWPFPFGRGAGTVADKPHIGRIGDRSRPAGDENWSFGSLSKKKKDTDSPWRKNDTIREHQAEQDVSTSSRLLANERMTSSLTALEQAQARLRREGNTRKDTLDAHRRLEKLTLSKPEPAKPELVKPEVAKPEPVKAEPVQPEPIIVTPPSTQTTPEPPAPPKRSTEVDYDAEITKKEAQFGQFLSPPPNEDNPGYASDHSDASNVSNKEPQLTGAARRRKRSSAARALKDKIAAETVDFELMADVQNWLRSLRLHKFGHAFEGLKWQQVVRMTDQDMIDAGVSTLGARRKLLKVFENVKQHCRDHDIPY